jgi:hypothetical protein
VRAGPLAFFARCNGFPRTPLYLPDCDELVAADLLWRYGWSASEAGLAFDDWKTEHRREMLEVMKQISAISGAPTPQRPETAVAPTERNPMSCTEAGPYPFAEDLQIRVRARR